MVGGARREVADVGREEDACDVGHVCLEGCYGDERGNVAVLNHAPDVDIALGFEFSRYEMRRGRTIGVRKVYNVRNCCQRREEFRRLRQ